MTEYANRHDVLKEFCRWCGVCHPDECNPEECEILTDVREHLPATDVIQVKEAEWIYGEDDGQDGWFCSECRFFIPWHYDYYYYGPDNINFIKDYHTCPRCSSRMTTYTGADAKGMG